MPLRSVQIRAGLFPVLAAALLLLALVPAGVDAMYVRTAGSADGDPYKDQVIGSSHGEGDVWGGEQGEIAPATDTPEREESISRDTTVEQVGWFTRIAVRLATIRTSLWFLNLE